MAVFAASDPTKNGAFSMTVFETVFFVEFVLAFLFGIIAGYIIHALVRAPVWMVQKLSE